MTNPRLAASKANHPAGKRDDLLGGTQQDIRRHTHNDRSLDHTTTCLRCNHLAQGNNENRTATK